MSSKTKREQRWERNRKHKMTAKLIWDGVGAAVIAVIGIIIRQGVRPAAGPSAGGYVQVGGGD